MILIVAILVVLLFFIIYKNQSEKFIIYTQNTTGSLGTFNPSETYPYPACYTGGHNYGCMNEDGSLIKGFSYTIPQPDGRCFKSLGDNSSTLLQQAYNKLLPPADIAKYFMSCGPGTGSMFSQASGRFVRIQRNGDTSPIKLSQFEVYVDSSPGVSTFIKPVDIHVSPYLVGQNYTLLMSPGNNTLLETNTGSIKSPAYIQLDLGSNQAISFIKVLRTSSDSTAMYIKNTTVSLIKDLGNGTGYVSYYIILDDTTVDII